MIAVGQVGCIKAALLGCAEESFVPSVILAQPTMVEQVAAGWASLRSFPRQVLCHHTAAQAAVRLVQALMLKHSVMFGDVVRLVVRTPLAETSSDTPKTSRAAQRSLRWVDTAPCCEID